MEKYNNFNYQNYYKNLKTEDSSGLEKTVLKLIGTGSLKKKNPDTRILESGFGNGTLILDLVNKGFNVKGIDISEKNVKSIQNKLKKGDLRADIVQGDILKTPFLDEEFDVIVACEILEHITNIEEAVKEIGRILKPGGTLIISVPYRQKIKFEECIFCHKLTPRNGHLHSFDREKLNGLFKKHNILSQKTKICFSKGNVFPFLKKIYIFPFSLAIDWTDLMISRIFGLFPPFLLVKFRKR